MITAAYHALRTAVITGSGLMRSRPISSLSCAGCWPAGAVGAAFIGVAAGYRNLIGIDIGGTSADIGLIHDAAPGLTDKGHIGDWPLALPMIDLATIDTGGGPIARHSPEGAFTVGLQSAGAEPVMAVAPSRPSPTRIWGSAICGPTCSVAPSRSTLT